MKDFFGEILAHSTQLVGGSLMPHGVCLLVEPQLIALMLLFHIIIWVDYLLIARFISSIVGILPQDAQDAVVAAGFQWFIKLCGWTHFCAFVVLFIGGPAYWLLTFALGVTAAISSHVALYLYRNKKELVGAVGGDG